MSYVLALLFAISFLPQGSSIAMSFCLRSRCSELVCAWRRRESGSLRVYGGPALLLLGYLLSLVDALRSADTWMVGAQFAVLFGLLLTAATERDPRTVLFLRIPSSTITITLSALPWHSA